MVLHGCTQSASGYDHSAAWSAAAEEHGFAVLFPQQQRGNNPNLCFNWFSPEDAGRGRGEALSIRQMIAAMQARHGTDPARVFVTGLSAGGAMAAVMLATYPELFAGGAIIAGLPFGVAETIPQAFEVMRGDRRLPSKALADLVREASDHEGPWPILSIWQGDRDTTVDPVNAQAIGDQWRVLHGVGSAPTASGRVAGSRQRVWSNPEGRAVIEEYIVPGMGHGTPLDPSGGFDEKPAPFMLDASISSTRHILAFWGIADVAKRAEASPRTQPEPSKSEPGSRANSFGPQAQSGVAASVRATIEDALSAAGLLR